MMRRRHKKSRRGCLECKRRHIKCDETRPRCLNCATTERECPYPAVVAESAGSGSDAGVEHTPPPAPGFASASESPVLTTHPEGFPPLRPDEHHHDNGDDVNMVHMELLHHTLAESTAIRPQINPLAMVITMRHALREPFLMYQTLALSARHLSVIRPEREAFYHNQAVQLQTRALSLFNAINLPYYGASIERRVPVFLFSNTLGFHALCDILSYRYDDFSAVIERFLGHLRIIRGVHAVMDGHWDAIQESELKPLVEMGIRWYNAEGEGHDCDDIRQRIGSLGLDEKTLEGANKAISHLQYIFDGRPDKCMDRVNILLSWPTMIMEPFVEMLETGRPEALVILAYYFLALHFCREIWMIGDAGQHLLTLLREYLGPEWSAWVEKPCQMLKEAIRRVTQFDVSRPSEDDADRIAEIHLLAMDANPLLHVQFPTPESLEAARQFLKAYTIKQLGDPASGALVARDPETGVIASFAKWDLPSQEPGDDVNKLESGHVQDIVGCRREFLDGYAKLAEAAKGRSFGDRPCYQLTFVCTDPACQGQGAGSMLTRKVLDLAAAEGLPVYLESTSVAVPMYEKLGFKAIDGFEMIIPRRGSSELSEKYEEVCMVWYP
ncbi:hypothetical protein QBC46DRAFT_266570 [Diplogelasinospora grovesii]|uniref:Zn(2)-C6 fungal-type domain-containing protein n=1 Tax=Diplogelasinospora grovesii TaxID=303347 RepID=A0AAN6N5N9_9PEZI|nr:hypothetical protein QBC46DRAFT_266570 [Diplogelasinospora grovesii]